MLLWQSSGEQLHTRPHIENGHLLCIFCGSLHLMSQSLFMGTIEVGADRLNVPAFRQFQPLILRVMRLAQAMCNTTDSTGYVHSL